MSRTKKGARKSGSDNHPTPRWSIDRFLEKWDYLYNSGPRWIDPSAGDGVIIEQVNKFRDGIDWTAVDIRDTAPALKRAGADEIIIGNFLTDPRFARPPNGAPKPYDVAILNPPFRLTMAFIKRCMEISKVVVVMQRMNFIGSDKRNEWFKSNIPDIYVIPNRVSFSGNGKADSVENAWHVWGPHPSTGVGEFHLLDVTTLEERRKDRRRIVRARDERLVTLEALFDASGSSDWYAPEDGDLWAPNED